MQEVTPSFIEADIMLQSLELYDSKPLYTFLTRTIGKENTDK